MTYILKKNEIINWNTSIFSITRFIENEVVLFTVDKTEAAELWKIRYRKRETWEIPLEAQYVYPIIMVSKDP